jgi:outer membrane protein TolC
MKQVQNHRSLLNRVVNACRFDRATKPSHLGRLMAAELPTPMSPVPHIRWCGTVTLVACLALGGVMAGQDRPTGILSPVPQLPDAVSAQLKAPFMPVHASQTVNLQQVGEVRALAFPAVFSGVATARAAAPDAIRRITLQEAQQMAAGASNPMVRLGELQVEAAKQHRLGLQGLYFPNLGAQFDNLHFNKNPGQVATFEGPLGNQHTVAANVFNKNETVVNLSAVQPVTPLMAIHQLVKIARADENIARSKAGIPVAEIAGKVEQNYFELLVAQQELISAEAESKKLQGKWLTASTGATSISTTQEKDMISAEQAVVVPASKVKELTASLNELLDIPEGTTLELIPPEPLVENISLTEVSDKAMVANPEVVQAEQTAIKAHAGSKISKMEYGPNVAIVAGYANQSAINTIVFPRAVGYLGVIATFTVFDFGKREHGVKEATANAEAADLGVQLTKAKVAASVKNSYFELQRSRQFTQLARRMASATRVVEASYQPDNPEVESARAKVEADMFRSELEYRQALAKLRALMGER